MSVKRLLLIVSLVLAAVSSMWAQSLAAPLAGTVLDGAGRLLSITGVVGSLLPGEPIAIPEAMSGRVPISVAFGSQGGAVKTETAIFLFDAQGELTGQQSSQEGPALFAFNSDGTIGWAFLNGPGVFQKIGSNAYIDAAFVGATIVALGAANGDSLTVLVQSGSALTSETIDLDSRRVSNQIPVNGATPATAFASGWLTSVTNGLQWQPADGASAPRQIGVPVAVTELQSSGPRTVAINRRWMLNTAWQVLEIPVTTRSARRTSIDGQRGESTRGVSR